jgi:hypothetical protein
MAQHNLKTRNTIAQYIILNVCVLGLLLYILYFNSPPQVQNSQWDYRADIFEVINSLRCVAHILTVLKLL